ncbi:MAG TPA: thiamine pyrophosphate-binding protein [Pseudolabrys sp.]
MAGKAADEMTVKLSDWVADKVAAHGIHDVFMITGGGAMHLNHSLGSHPQLACTFNHHEQACAVAAEAYYRLTNRLALVSVTSGPGGTNAITGVYGAHVDSIGMLVISGQVKWETTVRSSGLPLRQLGDQELDICRLVEPITKYCVMVKDPNSIRYHLEKAIYLATHGRPGPCWLDIPVDVQGARIDPDALPGFDPAELDEPWTRTDLAAACADIHARIAAAKRPVVFAGTGIRLAGQEQAFIRLIDKLGIPVVTAFNAHDLVWTGHPLFCGRPGTVGDRAGNFAAQNADLLLILGTRLNIRQVSYNWKSFARDAHKIWVDIDELELKKPTVAADTPVHADLKDLLPALADAPCAGPPATQREWLAWCRERLARYPVALAEYWNNPRINPYCFMQALFEHAPDDAIVVTGNATACVTAFQAAVLKPEQRLWSNSGCASMGYDLPAAIGAMKGAGGRPVVCLAGDGSIMMNLQELQTIAGDRLPIKIFLINNNGYHSIFHSHRNLFNGVEVGAGPKSGVSFPEFGKLAAAFGLSYRRCERHVEMAEAIAATLATEGPAVCEVFVDEEQPFAPKLAARQLPNGRIVSPALEDLSPFLPREELRANMIIDLIDQD